VDDESIRNAAGKADLQKEALFYGGLIDPVVANRTIRMRNEENYQLSALNRQLWAFSDR